MRTYSESAQLPRAALCPDGQNLRHLARHAQYTSCSLQQAQPLITNPLLVEQRAPSRNQAADPARNAEAVSAVLEHQTCDGNVLDQDERRFAIRAERKPMAHVV